MGYRGSKSVIYGRELYITVKEQRVDGSYIGALSNFEGKVGFVDSEGIFSIDSIINTKM